MAPQHRIQFNLQKMLLLEEPDAMVQYHLHTV